jgi:hypothetical protein
MFLTGRADGPPLFPGWQVGVAMRGAALALRTLASVDVDGPALLGERAAHTGFTRNGRVAPGGSCRLVPSADGWLALSLPRASDVTLANAWLGDAGLDRADPWPRVEAAIARAPSGELLARAAGLGLAVSALDEAFEGPPVRCHWSSGRWSPGESPVSKSPLVIDLSSLWAGPLCANLLGVAGARVVKVESAERRDRARDGSPSFFELLHHGHESVVIPFTEPSGRDALRRLIAEADIVIEASRPRALEQLGVDAAEHVARGAVWIGITAHGREGSSGERVGFGDDVGVAAGIVAGTPDEPCFCADAIADPIAGLHAAVIALAVMRRGGGCLVDVSMSGVARAARGERLLDERPVAVAPPRTRTWH